MYDLKAEWLIKNGDLDLIIEYVTKNLDIISNENLIKFVLDEYLSKGEIKEACNLFKTERVRTAMREELRPVMEELGIDDRLVLSGIKAEALSADKADTRLKALFKLADILDLEEKNTTKVQQVTGAVFQGFTDNMIEVAERKELKENNG